MIAWLAFGSVFVVWNVFQSSGLDFRLVAAGAVAPVLLDAPWGGQAYAHTLLVATAVLVGAMAVTPGRRLRRRRALSLAIGWYASLVLGASWAHKELFWWPAFGSARPEVPMFGPWGLVVIEEIAGLAAARWAWVRFGLGDPHRRRTFLRSGRLAVVGS